MGAFVCASNLASFRIDLPPRTVVALAAAIVLAGHAVPAWGQLVVNELYYDHPGGDDGYEFVELMNVSDAVVPMADVSIQFHNGTGVGWEALWSAAEGQVEPGRLVVVGGRYVSPPPDFVSGFSLQNGPDAVRVTVAGVPSDVVAYGSLEDGEYAEGRSAPGVDAGLSLARMPDGRDTGDNASDFVASQPSPGLFNLARVDAALSLSGRTPRSAALPLDGLERLEVTITNNGQAPIEPGAVALELWDSTGSSRALVGQSANAGVVPPGAGESVVLGVSLAPGYHWLLARIAYPADERPRNDELALLRRVGGPSLLVSEILCYPRDGCPQFVELFNAGSAAVDIVGFKLRDRSHAPTTITTVALDVPAGGYLAVTPDAEALRLFFPDAPPERVVEHAGTWPTFNRTGSAGEADSVVVADALFLPVEAVAYPPMGSDLVGRSLERVDLYTGRATQTWVLSPEQPGASPGRPGGRSLLVPPAPGSMEVTPRTFCPWIGETITVSVDSPAGTRAIVSVYDVEGRRLAELGAAIAFPAVFVWDGRHSGGRLMIPGLYLVVCESFSAEGERLSTRKVVVGCARGRG
jgi:hypothetical protein